MTGYAAILQHYDHWDNFVRLWKIGVRPDTSYMPVPWWGWHAVENESLQTSWSISATGHNNLPVFEKLKEIINYIHKQKNEQ